MKLYYLARWSVYEKSAPGVDKKVNSQAAAFEEHGIDVTKKNAPTCSKLLRGIPFSTSAANWWSFNIDNTVDVVYIRFIRCDYQFLRMLKKIRKQNNKVKIILEIPTYPYDDEFMHKKVFKYIVRPRDKFYRKYLFKYVDRIATFSDDKEIFGIPVIKIVNGIEVDLIRPKEVLKSDTGAINLIEVSASLKWHGYDRLLEGMGKYYKNGGKRNIMFHIVGDGPEIPKYKAIVKDYGIEDHVIFYGNKTGKDLDDIYDKCELGVEVLGMYRKNLKVSSSLKSREYFAKGLPIISGCEIDILKNTDFKYNLQFPNDDSIIDIDKMVKFYDEIYNMEESKEQIIRNIRDFAYKTCDMNVAMKTIIDYIKGDLKNENTIT